MNMNSTISKDKDKLIDSMKVVVSDAEDLLRATANQAGGKVDELRGRVETHLASAKSDLADAQYAALERAKQFGKETDDYVQANPWRAVGIAAGIGLVFGLLIGRR